MDKEEGIYPQPQQNDNDGDSLIHSPVPQIGRAHV